MKDTGSVGVGGNWGRVGGGTGVGNEGGEEVTGGGADEEHARNRNGLVVMCWQFPRYKKQG
jgi:hypothetical protein